MKLFKYAYGALSIIATIVLLVSFFLPDVTPVTQITLTLQAVGFGFICGMGTGADM